MWEQFFNWQSDMDWAWGPLLPLRPGRDTPIRPWVWARLFLVFTTLGLLLLALLALACVLLPRLAAARHYAPPAALSETLATLRAMATDPGTQRLLIGLAFCLPPLFFLACLPYHWAWNRRAARLGLGETRLPAPEKAPDGRVWPPAPRG
jgi:hypothetical protein